MTLPEYYAENKTSIECPEWNAVRYVHDWERYVPDELIEQWPDLDPLIKAAIHMVCEPIAAAEEWD